MALIVENADAMTREVGLAQSRMQRLVDAMVQSSLYDGVTLSIYDARLDRETHVCAGDLSGKTPFFTTGVTKLFTAAIIWQLEREGRVGLDAPFLTYVPNEKAFQRLCMVDGSDHTDEITLRHLMGHRSGLGDFFLFKTKTRGRWRFDDAQALGVDRSRAFEESAKIARQSGAVSRPGTAARAHYSDLNFAVLGRVIEAVEKRDFADVVRQRIAGPHRLGSTYVYCDPADQRPVFPLSHQNRANIARSLSAFQADGGIVSTGRDLLKFTRAFFEGYLFDIGNLPGASDWRREGFALEFAPGLLRVHPPRWRVLPYRIGAPTRHLLSPAPSLVGYLGAGGSFALHAPDQDLYLAGTVNQMRSLPAAVVFVVKAIEAVEAERRIVADRPAQDFVSGATALKTSVEFRR